jgi:hypothetical protein
MKPPVSVERLTAASSWPTVSSRWRWRRVSTTWRPSNTAAIIATGTLTRKIARHPNALATTPPRIGPLAKPMPEAPPQIASARRRRPVSGKLWAISASEHGINQAAPTPCPTRAAISIAIDSPPLHRALPVPNTPSPIRNPARAPTRSASAPADSSNAANASV